MAKNQPKRRTFTEAEKTELVQAAAKAGGTIPEAAERLGLNPSMLRRWIKEHGGKKAKPTTRGGVQAARLTAASPRKAKTQQNGAAEAIRQAIDENTARNEVLAKALAVLDGRNPEELS